MRRADKGSLAALVFALLLGAGAYFFTVGTRTGEAPPPPPEPVPATAVRLAPRDFHLEGEYRARLEAARDVAVAAKAGGTVVEDRVREGAAVREGDLLYRLEDDALRFAVRQAEAALDLAGENLRKTENASRPELIRRLEAVREESEAALAQAESDAARYGELHRQGAVPLSQKEKADLALVAARSRAKVALENLEEARRGAREEDRAAAEAAVRQAEASLLLARDALDKASVASPLDGVVASKTAFRGDTVRPGDTLAVIVDLSSFRITVGASQADVGLFRRGASVTVLPLPGGAPRTARIVDAGVKADGRTGAFPVILEMQNNPGGGPALRAGMDVAVRFLRASVPGALAVPSSALIREREGAHVFVAEDGRARRREVRAGPSSESVSTVASGLEAGELVIVVGQHRLRDGDLLELTVEE